MADDRAGRDPELQRLADRFSGCLLGAMLGDVLGAPVEAEPGGWIEKNFSRPEELLTYDTAAGPLVPAWEAGHYTDDTQMTLATAEWLIHDDPADGRALLARFAARHDEWRRYGPGTTRVIEHFRRAPDLWHALAKTYFPDGSWGNGSAMRAAPLGLRFRSDRKGLLQASQVASRTTHAHPLAIAASTLQASAVAHCVSASPGGFEPLALLARLGEDLKTMGRGLLNIDPVSAKLADVRRFIEGGERPEPSDVAARLGNGIAALDSWPSALTSFLLNPGNLRAAVWFAIRLGGDTDTIAAMTGALSGALLGEKAIPAGWLAGIKEPNACGTPLARTLARQLAACAQL